jgi:hypothetical protein
LNLTMKRARYAVLGCGLGLVFCAILATPMFFDVSIPKWGRALTETVNAPAFWLAHAWSSVAALPPSRGLGKTLAVPCVMMVGQWMLIGLLAGWVCHLGGRKVQ